MLQASSSGRKDVSAGQLAQVMLVRQTRRREMRVGAESYHGVFAVPRRKLQVFLERY
jgi:hypothetical protein